MDFSVIYKKFKISILILVLGVLGSVFLLSQQLPSVQQFLDSGKVKKQKIQELDLKKVKFESVKTKLVKEASQKSVSEKQIYRAIDSGADSETVLTEEFQNVIDLLKSNMIKAKSIDYEYDPAEDEFVSSGSTNYKVCRLNMELVAEYKAFERFLQDLYKYDYFTNIEGVEITSYDKNKKILIVNMKLKLYAKS